jgi:hypothetical protein
MLDTKRKMFLSSADWYVIMLFTVYCWPPYCMRSIAKIPFDFQQVGCFLQVLQFPPPIKLTAAI